ncbi:MAG: sigma-70 family RNA polymerase sigma factor [Chloroflexota bacterium]
MDISTLPIDDEQLIVRVARQDAKALGDLYDRHGRLVFGVLTRMLGSPESAEEVTQDAFHAVWQRASTYRAERGAVRAWVVAIARNKAIDWMRTKGKRAARELELDAGAELVGASQPDEEALTAIRDERVRAVVAELPGEQRAVLELAYWGGLSQSEIAAHTGVPLGTVKSRVRMAMVKLRDRLAQEGGGQ